MGHSPTAGGGTGSHRRRIRDPAGGSHAGRPGPGGGGPGRGSGRPGARGGQLEALARAEGKASLFEHALSLAQQGVITLEEAMLISVGEE